MPANQGSLSKFLPIPISEEEVMLMSALMMLGLRATWNPEGLAYFTTPVREANVADHRLDEGKKQVLSEDVLKFWKYWLMKTAWKHFAWNLVSATRVEIT